MSMKTQLLDPLAVLCRLISLNFYESNTKISIQDHIITIHKPSKYQGILRMCNGDGRENISELYYAIIRLVKWYLISTKSSKKHTKKLARSQPKRSSDNLDQAMLISQSTKFRKMIKYFCDALSKLQSTYNSGNVILALQYYINLLRDGLEGKYNIHILPLHIVASDNEYENLLDYNKIKALWDVKTIERIWQLYDCCYSVVDDEDIDDIKRNAFIKGYLRSIDLILETTDKEFKKLIVNSNKG